MAQLRIVALPADTTALQGRNMSLARGVISANHFNLNPPWIMIPWYTSLNDLWSQINTICTGPPANCLHILQLTAHGSPDCINGISDAIGSDNTDTFGDLMKANKDILCDEVHIYCNGCNTGIDFGPWESVAQNICDEISFDSNDFPHRVSVYGTKGYMLQSTSFMMRNERIIAGLSTRGGRCRYPEYWDGENATGDDVWNRFNNW